jgi:hypothetical protein
LQLRTLLFCQNTVHGNYRNSNKYTTHNKGRIFFYFMGERELLQIRRYFSRKRLQFYFRNVQAHDKQGLAWTSYPIEWLFLKLILEWGISLSDHYSIAAGVDHMKYVMSQNKAVINGYYQIGILWWIVVANNRVLWLKVPENTSIPMVWII